MEGEGGLRYADDGADLEVRDVGENVVAVNQTPLVTPWRGAQVILAVVDLIAAIPVVVIEAGAFPPILVFDITVVVAMALVLGVVVVVLGIVVMILGKGDTSHKTCGKDCER